MIDQIAFLKSNTAAFMQDGHSSSMKNLHQAKVNKQKTIVVATNKKNNGHFEMSGWIYKKATSTYLGMANWQKRYIWLKN